MRLFFIFILKSHLNPLYDILSYCSAYFSIIPLIIGCVSYRFLKDNEKIILLFVLFSTLAEFVGIFYPYLPFSKNISLVSLMNIYVIVETLTISVFYYRFFESKNLRIMTIVAGLLSLAVSIQQIAVNDKDVMNSVSITFESMIVIAFSVLTFHQLLQKGVYSNILDAPVFWINSGFLFYFTGNIFLHLFWNYLMKNSPSGFYQLWGLWHSLINISLFILISIGFWKTRKTRTSQT